MRCRMSLNPCKTNTHTCTVYDCAVTTLPTQCNIHPRHIFRPALVSAEGTIQGDFWGAWSGEYRCSGIVPSSTVTTVHSPSTVHVVDFQQAPSAPIYNYVLVLEEEHGPSLNKRGAKSHFHSPRSAHRLYKRRVL